MYAAGEADAAAGGGGGGGAPPGPPGAQFSSPAQQAAGGGGQPMAGDDSGRNSSSNRIDPAQIPRPEADQDAKRFQTRANVGQVPPPATSGFVVEDDGNCSPRFMRLSVNQLITTHENMAASALPFGVVIQPLADTPPAEGAVPLVDFGEAGPVRCGRCRAYVNPFFSFADGGRSFVCNMCAFVNRVPDDYFCEADGHGYRRDMNERPELCRGVVEFVAPAEYTARPPKPPPVVVVLEATFGAVAGGIFQAVVAALASLLPSMPPHTPFALVTFDDAVHFYTVAAEGGLRQMVVADATEVCLPLPPEALLKPLGESLPQIEEMLQTLPALFTQTKKPDAALGAALSAAHQLLEHSGGRLLVFQHTLPSAGPMKLSARDDVRVYGTSRASFTPRNSSCSHRAIPSHHRHREGEGAPRARRRQLGGLGQEAVRVARLGVVVPLLHRELRRPRVAVDPAAPHGRPALPLRQLRARAARRVVRQAPGGARKEPDALVRLRGRDARPLLQGCAMRRPSVAPPPLLLHPRRSALACHAIAGLRVDEYLMGQTKHGDVDVDVPGIDADSAFAVTFKHDDEKLEENAPACVQCALLYTTSAGERRIRVLTLGLQTTSSMASLYRYTELDALMSIVMRKAVSECAGGGKTLHQVRQSIEAATVAMLHTYRRVCASSTAAGQLILPESLKLLPLYALSLTKNALLRAGTDVRADERSALMAAACRMPLTCSVAFVYPRLFALHSLPAEVGSFDAEGTPYLPPALPLALEKLSQEGAFLLDDSVSLYVWVGRGVSPQFVEAVLGVRTLDGVDCSRLRLYPGDDPLSLRVNQLMNAVRSQRPQLLQSVRVVAPKDPLEGRFLSMLTEDRAQHYMSYVEFLCHIHRQIQSKFN